MMGCVHRPVLSELWFTARERATVTAIVSVAPYIGVSIGFIMGPELMRCVAS